MWNKFVVSALFCLILPCVLTAPVEDKDGQKETVVLKSAVKEPPTQGIDQSVQSNEKQSASNAEESDSSPSNQELDEPSPEELGQAMDDLTAEDIIRDVLITIRDHPIIMKELLEDKEKELDKALESREVDNSMFEEEESEPQLVQMPKTVQKKGYNWRQHLDSSSSESNESKNPYRYLYRDSSESESEKSDSDSSESKSSSESSDSEESDEKSDESTNIKMKRVPEIPEQTIDLTSLPEGGNDKRNKLHPRVYKALANQGHFKNPRNQARPVLENDPFIHPLPLLSEEDIHSMDKVKIPQHRGNKNLVTENSEGLSNPQQGMSLGKAPVKVKTLHPLMEWNNFPVAKENKDENELAALSNSKTAEE